MSKAETVGRIEDVVSGVNIDTTPAKAVDDIVGAVRKEALSGTTVKKASRKVKSLTGVEIKTPEARALVETIFECVFGE